MRRTHLFAGLFMTPWVFLYGVTGFLFNHPDAFPDRKVHTADRSVLAGTALEGFPTAPELADRVVEAAQRSGREPGLPPRGPRGRDVLAHTLGQRERPGS